MTDPREIAQRIRNGDVMRLYRNPLTSQISAADIDIEKVAAILAAEMPRWVPDFRKYARHLKGCKKGRQMPGSILTWECTCGLEVILAALPSPPREEAK